MSLRHTEDLGLLKLDLKQSFVSEASETLIFVKILLLFDMNWLLVSLPYNICAYNDSKDVQ